MMDLKKSTRSMGRCRSCTSIMPVANRPPPTVASSSRCNGITHASQGCKREVERSRGREVEREVERSRERERERSRLTMTKGWKAQAINQCQHFSIPWPCLPAACTGKADSTEAHAGTHRIRSTRSSLPAVIVCVCVCVCVVCRVCGRARGTKERKKQNGQRPR